MTAAVGSRKATVWRESPALLVHQRARWLARRHGMLLEVVVVRGGRVSAAVERRDVATGGFDIVARRIWYTPTSGTVREAQLWCESAADTYARGGL